MRDQLASTNSHPFRRINEVLVDGGELATSDPQLIDELRSISRYLWNVLSSDFELPASIEAYVNHDRERYLAVHVELTASDDHTSDVQRLKRRIHHQRIALRDCQRTIESAWKYTSEDWLRQKRWVAAHDEWLDLVGVEPNDPSSLSARVRRQRHALKRSHRLVEAQRQEMSALLHRLIVQAATG